jgi:hypothetical protein
MELQGRRVATLKLQVRKHGVFCSRYVKKHLVSIDADHVSMRSNSLRNACGNRAGTAADIKHKETWLQQFGEAAVVSLKSSSSEDARIGPV